MRSKSRLKPSKAPSSKSKAGELARLRQLKKLLADSNSDMSEGESIRRIRAAEARLKELQLAEQEGRLLPAEEVRRTWTGMILQVRNRFLALGDAICTQVAAESDVLKCRRLIDDEVKDALTALSQSDPETEDPAPATIPATRGIKEGTQ